MGVRRRELLAGAAATAGAAALPEPARAARRSRTRRADVVIVGAGVAGLVAAREIRAAGRSVIVVEARDRVGGRTYNEHLAGGQPVELGGQWATAAQTRVIALAKELGIETFPTHYDGLNVIVRNGTRQTYSGFIPIASPVGLAQYEVAQGLLDQLAAEVPSDRPWLGSSARGHDTRTVASWAESKITDSDGRFLFDLSISGVYGADAGDISLLDLLALITSVGGSFQTASDDAQDLRFVGGAAAIAPALAARLDAKVLLRRPVAAIEQHGRHADVVLRDGRRLRGRRVIVTLPPMLAGRLRYDPGLRPARDQYTQRQPIGSTIKFNAVYPTPFWRDDGLSGFSITDAGAVKLSYDNSPPDASVGMLTGFYEGADGIAWMNRTPAERKAETLRCLASAFGPRALETTAFFEKVWAADPFAGGAYNGFHTPGTLTQFGPALGDLDAPEGRIHWACSETANQWTGYIDGAIEAAQRTAKAVIAKL